MGSSGDELKHPFFRRSPQSFWRKTDKTAAESGPGRRPKIDDLLNDNQALIDKTLDEILKMHTDYRVEKEWKRVQDEKLLTCKFWPSVYNKHSLTSKEVKKWVKNKTPPEFLAHYEAQTVALQYLWARMRIISRSPQDLYWFVVWDNFWEHNYEMKCMQGNTPDGVPFKDIFGSGSSKCLLYNRCSREELESKLKRYKMKVQLDKQPHHFYPELLDKIFREMSRASLGNLKANVQMKMMKDLAYIAPDWKASRALHKAKFALYDTSGDGVLPRPEFNELNTKLTFEELNTDGDGVISAAEYNKVFDLGLGDDTVYAIVATDSELARTQLVANGLNRDAPAPAPAPVATDSELARTQLVANGLNRDAPAPAPAPVATDSELARTQLVANGLNRDAPAPTPAPPPRAAPAPASLQMMGSGDVWPAPAPAPAMLAFQQEFGGANSQAQALPQSPQAEEEEAAADNPFAWVGHTSGWVGNTWNDTVKAVASMIGGTPNLSSVDSADVRRVDPNRIVR